MMFELNKVFGAFCFAGLIAMASWLISLAAFGKLEEHAHEPEVVHYKVEGLEDAGEGAATMEAVVEEVIPIGTLLASADLTAGQKGFKKCAACHTVDEGGKNKVGPNLWDIVNRPIASVDGFGYSDAMTGLGGDWDYDRLNEFLLDPKGYVPGTKMAFKGVSKDGARANLIAYLRSLSGSPAELPAE